MAKNAIVTADTAKNFYVPDLHTVSLESWPRRGGSGVFLNSDVPGGPHDCYVCEIPAGSQLAPERQVFDEMIYVLDGRGSTAVWNDVGPKVTFEWKAGAIFAVPLNAWHQHFNGSGKDAARFVSVTNASWIPGVPDILHSLRDSQAERLLLDVNLVADALNLPLIAAGERGVGHITLSMASGRMKGHIMQFPAGASTEERTVDSGARIIVMSGEGFSLMWPEDAEPLRVECKKGTMIVSPAHWRHQQFNTGSTPFRCLAFQ